LVVKQESITGGKFVGKEGLGGRNWEFGIRGVGKQESEIENWGNRKPA
jgi:hypothetical protein